MTRAVWILVLAVGCTKPNPLDCSDGLCSEADHPFCDVDGSLGGVPNTCVTVACTPNEPAGCRGDVSLVCSASGTNYDLVEGERGCDPMYGCRQCTTNEECANPSPVCDSTTSACRACKVDDECGSKVCDSGSCVPASGILYASPNGSDTGMCTLAEPCSVSRTITLAKNAGVAPIIRMLPGTYLDGLGVSGVSSQPIRIVATGATVVSATAIAVTDGATLDLRGVTASGNNFSVNCSSSTSAKSSLTVRDSLLRAGTSSANIITADHCKIALTNTDLDLGGSTGSGIAVSSETSVTTDRTRWHGAGPFSAGGFGTNIDYKVSNSLLENVSFVWATTDQTGTGSYIEMDFNTITQDGGGLNCAPNSGSAHRTRRFANNFIYSTNASSAIDQTDCILDNNVLYPFDGAAGTNIVGDPRFANAGAHDFHLMSGSPAIDAAAASVIPPSADYDGTPRPQGARSDIGALEYNP